MLAELELAYSAVFPSRFIDMSAAEADTVTIIAAASAAAKAAVFFIIITSLSGQGSAFCK